MQERDDELDLDDDDGYCQDCGEYISISDGTAYVTASGDVFCRSCGIAMDALDEQMMDEEGYAWDYYPADWNDEGSGVSELEPDDTPRERYIGEGSEYPDTDDTSL